MTNSLVHLILNTDELGLYVSFWWSILIKFKVPTVQLGRNIARNFVSIEMMGICSSQSLRKENPRVSSHYVTDLQCDLWLVVPTFPLQCISFEQ